MKIISASTGPSPAHRATGSRMATGRAKGSAPESPSGRPQNAPSSTPPLPQFLLVLAGVCFFVGAFCHVPRIHQRLELEREDYQLRAQIDEIRAETAQLDATRLAFLEDSHIRDSVLRRVTGEHPHGAMTVNQWLSQQRGHRGAGIQAAD